MKLLRYHDGTTARLGALQSDRVVKLDAMADRFPTMLSIIAGGEAALQHVADCIGAGGETLALAEARLLAPVERPGKYLAIGMNYAKHVDEAERLGVARSKQQTWFNKQTTCLSGPFDPIDPGVTERLDYEVELGLVIGRSAKGVDEDAAPRHVFGWFVANDVSARDWQFHSPTFTVGKSFDTHGPIGPWITTADEVSDPHALRLTCRVNGEVRQSTSTGDMIYDIWKQISYLSTAFTLESGDLLATGTPEGVGGAMDPQRFLVEGDVVRCEIEGLGAIENRVAAPRR